MITSELEMKLTSFALNAREKAVVPFSNFKVGVAILVDNDIIFTGANVEFARNQNIHAEFVAMDKVLKNYILPKYTQEELAEKMKIGLTEIIAIAEANSSGIPGCGNCRQMLYEINPKMIFYSIDTNNRVKRYSIKKLYPNAYRSNDSIKL